MYRKLSLLTGVVLGTLISQGYGTVFEKQPGSATRLLGDSLDIPCVTKETHSLVYWQTVPDGISFWTSDEHFSSPEAETRYQMIGVGYRDITLRINHVQINEPNVRCTVFGATDPSSPSNITVVAVPYDGYPSCSASASILSSGSTLDLACTSVGGVPAAILKWKYGKDYLSEGPGIKQDPDANDREGRTLVHSFKVNDNHNGKRFTCTAENTAISMVHERGELPTDKLSCDTEKLNVTYGPKTTTIGPANPYIITEDGDAVIKCKATGGNPDVYHYRYRQLTKSWSGWMDTEGQRYSRLRRDKKGVYSCQSKNSDSIRTTIEQLTLDIHYPPEDLIITRSNDDVGENYSIKEGEDLILDCKAQDSNPDPSYKWTKVSGGALQAQDKEDQLKFLNINRTRAGTYTCTATNEMTPTGNNPEIGTETKSVAITVQYKPGPASTSESSRTVTKGNEVTLKCSVSEKGVPAATFTWTKDGKVTKTGDTQGEYDISSAQVNDDDGQHQCTPTNSVGDGAAATITVDVETFPTVKSHPDDRTVMNSANDWEMKCSFEAKPTATISWKYKNGTRLPDDIFSWSKTEKPSGHNNKYTTTESTLTWKPHSDPLYRRHSVGHIKCSADNGVGGLIESNQAELTVEYAPYITRTDPSDLKRGAAKDEEVSLFVEVDANPRQNIKWEFMKNGSNQEVSPGSEYDVKNTGFSSNLILKSITVEQFGLYRFTANNQHNSTGATFHVSAYDKPGDPSGLNLTVTAVSLFAEWNRGWNGGLSQTFILEYSGRSKQIADRVNESRHFVKLTESDGIRESIEYTVTVHAKNEKGPSGSQTKTITTKAKPSVITTETTVKHDKPSKQATITWSVSAETFTLVVVEVCNVKQTCLRHNISDTSNPTTVRVPDGDVLDFSFFFFDGREQVSEQKNAIKVEPAKPSDNIGPIIGAVIGVIVFLALIIGIPTFFIWRKRIARDNDGITSRNIEQKPRGNIVRRLLKRFRGAGKNNTSAQTSNTIYERTNPTYVNQHMEEAEYAHLTPSSSSAQTDIAYEEVEIKSRECTRDAIRLGHLVHKGDFFEVFTGRVQGLPQFRNGTGVIVKLPRDDSSAFEQAMLVNDIKALKCVGHHINVVKLLAQCMHKDPVMAVLALEKNWALRKYINQKRNTLEVDDGKLKVFIKLIHGVVNGMTYLDSLELSILHRCVSADHVLVSKDGVCKVSGFGFATDILEREEYERSQEMEVT